MKKIDNPLVKLTPRKREEPINKIKNEKRDIRTDHTEI
jgi:hypothetical protein